MASHCGCDKDGATENVCAQVAGEVNSLSRQPSIQLDVGDKRNLTS